MHLPFQKLHTHTWGFLDFCFPGLNVRVYTPKTLEKGLKKTKPKEAGDYNVYTSTLDDVK